MYKLHSLTLGYFYSSSVSLPRCTMPDSVCSAYFIHETIRDTCSYTHTVGIPLPVLASSSFPTPPSPSYCNPSFLHPASFIFHLRHQRPTVTALYWNHSSFRWKSELSICTSSLAPALFLSGLAWLSLCPTSFFLNSSVKFLAERNKDLMLFTLLSWLKG